MAEHDVTYTLQTYDAPNIGQLLLPGCAEPETKALRGPVPKILHGGAGRGEEMEISPPNGARVYIL